MQLAALVIAQNSSVSGLRNAKPTPLRLPSIGGRCIERSLMRSTSSRVHLDLFVVRCHARPLRWINVFNSKCVGSGVFQR